MRKELAKKWKTVQRFERTVGPPCWWNTASPPYHASGFHTLTQLIVKPEQQEILQLVHVIETTPGVPEGLGSTHQDAPSPHNRHLRTPVAHQVAIDELLDRGVARPIWISRFDFDQRPQHVSALSEGFNWDHRSAGDHFTVRHQVAFQPVDLTLVVTEDVDGRIFTARTHDFEDVEEHRTPETRWL